MCYGILLGCNDYVLHQLKAKANKIVNGALKSVEILAGDRQALWTVLRMSTAHRFGYFCQLAPASLTKPVAPILDERLWNVLKAATALSIPRGAEGDLVNCPVGQLNGRSYQEWVVRLAIRFHGWGFRSLAETCGPAYLEATETALPFMAARDRLCPDREEQWGGEECWGEGVEDRWRVVFESGCQEGMELRRAWERMVSEARQGARWLGEEVEEIFTSGADRVGGGSVTGDTRGELVEALKGVRFCLLTEALAMHWPKKDRHAWAWRQR